MSDLFQHVDAVIEEIRMTETIATIATNERPGIRALTNEEVAAVAGGAVFPKLFSAFPSLAQPLAPIVSALQSIVPQGPIFNFLFGSSPTSA